MGRTTMKLWKRNYMKSVLGYPFRDSSSLLWEIWISISSDQEKRKENFVWSWGSVWPGMSDQRTYEDHSSTLLDVILTTQPDFFRERGVYNPEISDHHMVYASLKERAVQHAWIICSSLELLIHRISIACSFIFLRAWFHCLCFLFSATLVSARKGCILPQEFWADQNYGIFKVLYTLFPQQAIQDNFAHSRLKLEMYKRRPRVSAWTNKQFWSNQRFRILTFSCHFPSHLFMCHAYCTD